MKTTLQLGSLLLAALTSLHAVTDLVQVNLTPSITKQANRRALGVNMMPWLLYASPTQRAAALQLFDDFSAGAVFRYGGGGGLSADTYFWETNVGYGRQPQDFFGSGTQSAIDPLVGLPCGQQKVSYLVNGTDEVLGFVDQAGGKGLLTLNAGATATNGGLWSPPAAAPFYSNTWSREGRALNWADYVNSPSTTTGMGYFRNLFGRSQPYGVKIFEIGNEHYIDNVFQGQPVYWNHTVNGTTYGQRALGIAAAVKLSGGYDSAVRFVYCAFEWDQYYPMHTSSQNPPFPSYQKTWNVDLKAVLQTAGDRYRPGTDLLSAHLYTGTPGTNFSSAAWCSDMTSVSLEDNAHIEHLKSVFGASTLLAVTEHDALYRVKTSTPQGCASGVPYVPNRLHALTVADKVMNFATNPNVYLATLWHSGMLIDHRLSQPIQTVGWVYALLAPIQTNLAEVVVNDTGTFQRAPIMATEGNGTGVRIPGDTAVPKVHVLATVSGSGAHWIASLFFLNRVNEDKQITVSLAGSGLDFSTVRRQYVRFPDDTSTANLEAAMKKTVLDPGGGPSQEVIDYSSGTSYTVSVPRLSVARLILVGPGYVN